MFLCTLISYIFEPLYISLVISKSWLEKRWRSLADFYTNSLGPDNPLAKEWIVWHSLRASMMLILIALKKAIFEIQILARHKVAASTLHYLQKGFRRGTLIQVANQLPQASLKTLAEDVTSWYQSKKHRDIVSKFIRLESVKPKPVTLDR